MKTPRTRFHRIRLGFGNGYLIQAQRGCIVIDAGSKNQQQPFIRHLEKNNLSGDEVGLIVITHVHFDHVGSLKAIKELCKCPVAVHERESQLLRGGVVVFHPGTNLYAKAASYIGQKLMKPLFRFPSVEFDIVISEDFSLEPFGIPVDIIPTPGHTGGSLSVLLSSGQAFVGDLAANYLPFGIGPACTSTFCRKCSRTPRKLAETPFLWCHHHMPQPWQAFQGGITQKKIAAGGRVT